MATPTKTPTKPIKHAPPSQPPIAPVTGKEDWSEFGEIVRLKGNEAQ